MAIQLAKRLLTIDEYHRMAETGILTEEDKVELLHGEIYQMSPIGSEHSACVNRLNALFNQVLAGRAIVSVQNPVQIPELSEPGPDIALLQPRDDFYKEAHPLPEEVFLIVEVADSSFYKDQQVKLPIYANAGIPEYWIINLEKREIEVYWKPGQDSYEESQVINPGEKALLRAFKMEIPFEKLLG